MKHLFVARHGAYSTVDGERRLNDEGRAQMEALGKDIEIILNGGSVYIISSTAPRAVDSARVLGDCLAIPEFEGDEMLWSEPGRKHYQNPELLALVGEREHKADALIIMTHLEITEDFPPYFLQQRLGIRKYFGEIQKGRAIHIHIDGKEYQVLPRKNAP